MELILQSSREEYEEPDTERDSLFHRSYYMERPEEEAVVGPSVSPMKSSSERKVHVSSWLNSYQKINTGERGIKKGILFNQYQGLFSSQTGTGKKYNSQCQKAVKFFPILMQKFSNSA